MGVDRFAYLCWKGYLAVSQILLLDWAAVNTAYIKNNFHYTVSVKVYIQFFQENDPTQPCAMHECVGMDWNQKRNEGVYICTVLAPCNCSMLNFNNQLECVY